MMLSLLILLLLLSYISLTVCSIGSSSTSTINTKNSISSSSINSKSSIVNSKSSTVSINDSISINDNNTINLSQHDRSLSKVLIVLLPLLYFISVSLNHISLPKVVNKSINGMYSVSHQSASTYGMLSGIDAAFTFLSVNLIGISSS